MRFTHGDDMDNVSQITQAYSQAPWRKQLQVIGIFLSVLIILLMAASVFVSITARAATLGREIQRYRLENEDLEYEIANLRSEVATLNSVSVLQARALELGFRPATTEEITYIRVTGYTGKPKASIATPAQTVVSTAPVLLPAFTQSWVEWLTEQLQNPAVSVADSRP